MENTIYNFSATTLQNKLIPLKEYEGKVIIIVNTASKCGLTPQYTELEQIYKKYKEQGLIILGFPCNQFGNQEPGTDTDITQTCQINYGVTFPIFQKIEVNGPNAHPIFKYLKENKPGILGKKIRWNFTKFIINKQGIPIKRYAPITKPSKMIPLIEKLLKE